MLLRIVFLKLERFIKKLRKVKMKHWIQKIRYQGNK